MVTTPATQTLRVEHPGVPSYDVHRTASLAPLGELLAEVLPVGKCVVVSNPVVAPLHADAALESLRAAGWSPTLILVPDGEAEKTLANWSLLVAAILDAGVSRDTPVLALGGGVTGDLVGFAAATTLRGLPFVQVATTLLAMVDSSVGGKTGVNAPQGKNLVGAFHPPRMVLAAMNTLETLPDAELRCGLGEVVKHAVLAGEAALARLEALAPALRAREVGALAAVVGDSVRLKAEIVASDPEERGRRAILNLGHTLGHALERACGLGTLRHGEAVAIGLAAMARHAARRGACDPMLAARIEALLRSLSLPTFAPHGTSFAEVRAALGFDKKRSRGMIRVVVPHAPGEVSLQDLPPAEADILVSCCYLPEASP